MSDQTNYINVPRIQTANCQSTLSQHDILRTSPISQILGFGHNSNSNRQMQKRASCPSNLSSFPEENSEVPILSIPHFPNRQKSISNLQPDKIESPHIKCNSSEHEFSSTYDSNTSSPSTNNTPNTPKSPIFELLLGSKSAPFDTFRITDLNLPTDFSMRITALNNEYKRAKNQLQIEIGKLKTDYAAEQQKCKVELTAMIQKHKFEMNEKFDDSPKPQVLELKSISDTVCRATAKSTECFEPVKLREQRRLMVERHKAEILELNQQCSNRLSKVKSNYEQKIQPLQEKMNIIGNELKSMGQTVEEFDVIKQMRFTPRSSQALPNKKLHIATE